MLLRSINIQQIFTGQEFRGNCATNNPMLKNQIGECSVGGKKPEEECKMPEVGQQGAKGLQNNKYSI